MSDQRTAVIDEALSWRGTPFRDCARVKGAHGGIDCGQFLYAVYGAVGAMPADVESPRYNMQFMLNRNEEWYVAEILKFAQEITADEALSGDVVVLRWGHCYSHGAILLDSWCGRIINALNGMGVVVTDAARDGRIQATLQKFRNFPPRFFRPNGW